jgi:hypothetical protein
MLDQFFNNPAEMLFLGGIALATWLLMRRLFIRRNRKAKRIDPIKEITKKEKPLQSVDAPAEALKWEIRLHDLGREITARIDRKLAALQALTRVAHEAAERLEIATQHAAEIEARHYGSSPLDAIERRLHDVTFEVSKPVEKFIVEPPTAAIDPVESLRRVVKRLLANGLTAEEISAQTEMPLGEVEFLASTLAAEKVRAA